MRIFISAGEPSGDLHGANLAQCLRRLWPDLEIDCFGGEKLQSVGRLVYPLAEHPVVGIGPALVSVPHFYRVLRLADRHFQASRPDVVVLIDYPGFHWWLAGLARKRGIPVVYFVPPQLWAWGGWRAGKMRRLVNRVLCNLPFERAWYEARDIPARYIGHPYFDELRAQRLDAGFLAEQRARSGTIIGLLPGSRRLELEYNPPTLIKAAALIHRQRPETRFLVACFKEAHRQRMQALVDETKLPIEVHVSRTPEIIELAHSTISVSGSVSLELLHRATPSVVTYRASWFGVAFARLVMRCRYICLVNLLAEQELFPEFLSHRCQAEALAHHVIRWLNQPADYAALCEKLAELRDGVAETGACQRAAEQVLDLLRDPLARAA